MTLPEHPNPNGGLFSLLRGNWDKAALDAYSKSIEHRETDTPAPIARAFQMIDAKTAGLLTHVSMMIAGLGICAPFLAQHPIEEAIIVAEISIYLLIALGCLRCLSVLRWVKHKHNRTEFMRHIQRELLIRHELYGLCNRVSMVFTIAVFMSLPLMLWWRPQ